MRTFVLLAIGMAAPGLGCGDGSDPDALSEDTAAPLAWEGGDRVAVVTAHRLTRDPLLGEPECSVTVQVGEAGAADGIVTGEGEGACFVLTTPPDLRAPGWAPLAGGTVDLRVGSTVDRVSIVDTEIGRPLSYACDRMESARTIGVVSVAGEDPADVLGDFTAEIPLQAAPVFSAPEELRPGIATWPAGPLTVRWNGGLGDSVHLVLMAQDRTLPEVHCFTADDGEMTFPDRLLESLRAVPATLEVGRVAVEVQTVDGVAVHLGSRSATQLWLQLPE